MSQNEKALSNTRRKISEIMRKEDSKLTFGYKPAPVERNEGDVWNDPHGRTWTKKDGLVQSVTKLDGAKTPWWCPKCDTPLNGHNLRAYRKTGYCHECMLKEEMELKISGRWHQEMVDRGKRSHIDWLTDKIQELQEYYDNVTHPEFIHADNEKILMMEKWNIDLDTVKKDLLKEIDEFKEHLSKVQAGEYDEIT